DMQKVGQPQPGRPGNRRSVRWPRDNGMGGKHSRAPEMAAGRGSGGASGPTTLPQSDALNHGGQCRITGRDPLLPFPLPAVGMAGVAAALSAVTGRSSDHDDSASAPAATAAGSQL